MDATSNRLLAWQDVLNRLNKTKTRKQILLGNGFSLACFPEHFKYDSLFAWAITHGKINAHIKALSDLESTTNFEVLLKHYDLARPVAESQGKQDMVDEIDINSQSLKERVRRPLNRLRFLRAKT